MRSLQKVESSPVKAPGQRLLTRIMALDDNAVDQMVCKRAISCTKISEELISLTTPAAALSYFSNPESPPVDLILLDVNMPRMNGFEFLEAAQRLITLPQVPPVLIMLTTPLGPLHREEAQKFDMIKGYLEKPLSPLDLELAVQSI